MRTVEPPKASQFIRKMRGGSQSILVQASDGLLYVVKLFDNLQGPNLPFNDALGTEIYREAGLPVPGWKIVEVTAEFLDSNPLCWTETMTGWHRPAPGMCFGSQFLSLKPHSLFEILPQRSFCRIRNRRDFWTSWVLLLAFFHLSVMRLVTPRTRGSDYWFKMYRFDSVFRFFPRHVTKLTTCFVPYVRHCWGLLRSGLCVLWSGLTLSESYWN